MKKRIATHIGIGLAFAIGACYSPANPTGGSVVGGSASISGEGTSVTTINQSSHQAIINWQDFSIGAGEITHFVQPSSTASILNRVISGDPSLIYGSMQANGKVFVINPNGILVGAGGIINTKGFVASTLDVPNASFMSGGNLVLSGNSGASIQNQGNIQALGGNVFLIAHSVENSGTLLAPQGTVGLAAGSQVQLVQAGSEHLSVLAGNSGAPAASIGVNNVGTIDAASAELKAAGGNIYALAINNGGVVRANGIVNKGGHIYLGVAGGNIQNSGTLAANNADGSGGTVVLDGGHNATAPSTVVSSGTIQAAGTAAGSKGGTVEILGDQVGVYDHALVNVSGDGGGGTALIGGDEHGANPAIQNAQDTFVSSTAHIDASAGSSGNGGKVVVWSDHVTVFDGGISAAGGRQSGNGGFVEVSGKGQLGFNGTVDLSAPGGVAGTLLLDPATFTVQSSNPDLNGDGTTGDDIAALTDLSNPNNFPGAASIITAGAVNALLTGNATLILSATVSGTVNAAITGTGNANLTLNAPTLNLNAPVTLAGSGVLSGNATTVNVGTGGSIQNGVDAVSAGGLVNIASGTYLEAVNVGKNLSLAVPSGAATANSWASGPAVSLTLSGNFNSSLGMNFQGPVTLGADATLSDTASGNIRFGSTVDGAHTLTVNTAGTTTFGGPVGTGTALTSLATDAAGATAINGDVTTTAGQTYNDAVTLGGAGATRTLTGVNVDFANTIAGAGKSLTVNDSGTTTFGNTVSAVNALTTDAAGGTALNGDITTTAGQTYNDAVTLGGAGATRTLTGVNVDFANTIAGAGKSLTVNDSGTTTFGNTVSAVNALTTDAAGGTALNGDITTTAGQTYNDAVTLGGASATRTLTGVNVHFANTITGAGKSLTVDDSGTTTFGNTVSAVNALTTDAPGGTAINANVTTTGTQTYNDQTVTASGITLAGSTITFNSQLSPGGDATAASLAINGNLTFGPASIYYVTLNGTAAGSQFDQITVNGGSTVTISSGADLAGSENFAYNVGNTVRIINNNGSLSGTFLSPQLTVDGQQFTVSYGGNNTTLTRSISSWTWDGGGGVGNPNWTTKANWVGNNGFPGVGDTVIFAGTTSLNPNNNIAAGLSLNQIIFQSGSGAFTLGGNAISLTGGIINNSANLQTINMPITLAAAQTFGAASGPLAFGALGTIQGPFDLTLSGPFSITLGAAVGGGGSPLNSLTVSASTPLIIGGGAINTVGAQAYNSALSLGADTTLNGTVLTLAGVTGNNNSLTLANSGAATLGGVVSGVKVLTANAGTGTLTVNNTIAANKVVDNQVTTLSGGSVTTTAGNSQDGSQTYSGAVTLGANTTITGVGVNFGSTIGGAGDALTVNAGSGALTLGGNVGAGGALGALALNSGAATTLGGSVNAASLTTDAGGTTAINGDVTTTAGQTYNDAITLGGAGTIRTLTGVNVDFANTVAGGGKSLAVNDSGTTTFGNTVSAVNALTTDAPGSTVINGDITTTAGQTYNDSVTLGGAGATRTLTGVNVDFVSTIAGAGKSLTVDDSGSTTFGNAVSGINALLTDAPGSVAVDSTVRANSVGLNGTTITLAAAGTTANPSVQTTGGGQTYAGAVTLGQDTVLEDTSGGDIGFSSTVNGAHNLQLNTAGTTTLGGVVGGSAALASLETDDAAAAAGSRGGTTLVNQNVTTTAGQTFHDRIVTANNITLKGSTIAINGVLSPGDDANAASLSINGNLTFGPASTYYVTLNGTSAGSQFDQITVNGGSTVTISSGADLAGQESHSFNVGNTLRIINNNGSRSGTFLSPQLTIDGQQFNVTYSSGNDVILARSISSWTWDGGGGVGNPNWTTKANWVGNNGYPGDGDTVTFAGTTSLNPNNNNAAGLTLNQIIFANGSGAFTLGGNAISLTGGILNNSANVQTINMPITLAADQAFGAAAGPLAFGALSTVQGPFTLTLNGPFSITLGAAVGGAGNPLAALIANTPLNVSGGAINTVGAQSYNSPLTLGNSATLASSGGGVITFGSTVDGTTAGAQGLTVNGDVSLGGAIGGLIALSGVTIVSPDAVLLNQNITANSVAVHSGTSGTGNTTFGSGVTVQADTQSYQAGDGTGGAGTAALVDLVGNSPTFRNLAGSGAPLGFTYEQDGSIASANVPAASQFGGVMPASFAVQSFDGAVALPGMTLPGTLQVSALDAISQSGSLIVGGLASFTSTGAGANGDITLNAGANSFGSLALSSANGSAVSVSAANDTALDTVAVNNGSLAVNSGGAITQVGGKTVTVGGLASFTSTGSGASGNITLDNAGNNVGSLGLNSANGLAVSATDAGATALDTVSVTPGGSGTLAITSGGGITQVAGKTVTVGGAATFTAPTGSSILLGNAGNTLNSTVTFVGNGGNLQNVSLLDSAAFTIQGMTLNGTLNLVSGGAINQSGPLNIGGLASFSSTGSGLNGNITLNDPANVFGSLGLNSASGSAVSATESGALVLDNISVNPAGGGTLALTSGGGITQVAGKSISVGGGATFIAPSADSITLGNAGNAFNGPVTFAGNGGNLQNVTVANSTAFDIGGLTLGGTLDVTSGGAVTQSGAIIANGLQVNAAGPVTLNNPGNQVNSVGGTVTGPGKSFAFTDQGTTLNVSGLTTANGNITLTADAMTLAGPVNSGSGNTTLQPLTPGLYVNMGSVVAGDLNLSQADLNQVTAKILQIGNTQVPGILNKNTVSISGLPIVTLLYVDSSTTTEASSQAFAQLLAGAILPVPKANVTGFSGVSIDAEEAAKILPPGCIGVLFLQIPFPPSQNVTFKIEDISKWTGGHVAMAGATTGPQMAK